MNLLISLTNWNNVSSAILGQYVKITLLIKFDLIFEKLLKNEQKRLYKHVIIELFHNLLLLNNITIHFSKVLGTISYKFGYQKVRLVIIGVC